MKGYGKVAMVVVQTAERKSNEITMLNVAIIARTRDAVLEEKA